MGQPIYTAIVFIQGMPEKWQDEYPAVTVKEFTDEEEACHFVRNFIKSPVAGGPDVTYTVKYHVVFGVEVSSGNYGVFRG